MAQQVLVQLVDDLDGTTSDDISTIQFGLDGVEYEIDLRESNAERIRNILADYVTSARRTGGRRKPGTRPGQSGSSGSDEAARIRKWAAENGVELAARGRIPSHVIEQYKQAQEAEARPKSKTSAAAKRPSKRAAAAKKD